MSKWAGVIGIAALAAACGGQLADEDVEACEHLRSGPAVAVTAVAAGDPPEVDDDHNRYDVTLAPVAGGNGGDVRLLSAEATEYALFVNRGVVVTLFDDFDLEVAPEDVATASPACPEIRGKFVFPLDVAPYTVRFTPSTETTVGVVVEHLAHQH